MKLVSIKTAADCPLKGITCDFTKEDGRLTEVTLRDAEGNVLVFRQPASYDSLKVMVPQEHERADRYKLHGNFLGVAHISEFFEDSYAASEKLRDYDEKANGDSGLKVERVCCLVSEDGAVVKEIAA
jgi:hypothetical protein